ncbi:methionine adenosyltransferase [Candidatus Woesearchaeota archaeon]|nr:MAG: methionine adenosyltransferase [Candidatus Woesearchaeota archaeon]
MHVITSESVTEGHPDKLCDQISDAILDDLLRQDPDSRVAVECLTTRGLIVVAGEVTTKGFCDIQKVARTKLKEIGYTDPAFGIDYEDAGILVSIQEQSPDIAQGVNENNAHEQGAGDQGMMFGFACDETPELMPLSIVLAHQLARKLAEVRKKGIIPYLGPDGKSQVTVAYENEIPQYLTAVVIGAQHKDDISEELLRKEITHEVIMPICKKYMREDTKIFINATGKFVKGGPEADTGLTGRKIIVDTYGSIGRHGGGAFSGKDPSKVDRSGAYMARYVAKNIVKSGIAKKCEVQLSYVIGVAEPTSVYVNCYNTNKIPEEKIVSLIRKHFKLTPKGMIASLDLKKPVYQKTAAYGHFGREEFSWEKTDKAELLREDAGL